MSNTKIETKKIGRQHYTLIESSDIPPPPPPPSLKYGGDEYTKYFIVSIMAKLVHRI